MRVLLLLLLVVACACPALAQSHDAKAREITNRSEYRGYRVEQPGGGGPSGGDGKGRSGGDSGRTDAEPGPRRGAGAEGPSGGGSRPAGGGSGGGGGGLEFPGWLGTLLQAVAWIIVIGAAVVALFFIIKALLGIRWKRKPKAEKKKVSKSGVTESEKEETAEPEDFDVQVFEDALEVALRDYRDALARQDWAAATLLAYRVFWLRAGWKGCVEISDTRTWRDALRMVRQSETRREVRELLPLVERVRYADHMPERAEFNDWSAKLERINPLGVL